jgi:hypothetical protein
MAIIPIVDSNNRIHDRFPLNTDGSKDYYERLGFLRV